MVIKLEPLFKGVRESRNKYCKGIQDRHTRKSSRQNTNMKQILIRMILVSTDPSKNTFHP